MCPSYNKLNFYVLYSSPYNLKNDLDVIGTNINYIWISIFVELKIQMIIIGVIYIGFYITISKKSHYRNFLAVDTHKNLTKLKKHNNYLL